MSKAVKYAEKAVVYAAKGAWVVFERLNRISPNPSFTPKWSDKPLQKSYQKEKPPLGWPRTTDSLCPKCVPEIRQQILDGKLPYEVLLNEKVGEIKAQIIERDGKIWMVKDCPKHGHFEDVMSMDTAFFKHLEESFPGRDVRAHNDKRLHNHGTSTVTHGRGAVLTIDLTNRCNMMCDPCFMDANQVGFVHELTWDEIKTMLDNAITLKPKRQMSVQFSGGEPTLSPYFLDAVAYCRKVGYNSVQAASNGIEFAKSKELCRAAAEAGLRYVYLQFDGIGNAANSHRKVGNLFDVKLQAINNLHEAGVEIVPVTTIINGINNEQVGRIIQFALDNPKTISFLSFQPVSFTGRDEDISDERRFAQRYTLSHMAHDIKNQMRLRRAGARLVPHQLHGHLLRLGRPDSRAASRVGPALLRLPSQLRHRHGHDDRQGNKGSRARHRLPQHEQGGQGSGQGQRRGPRQVDVGHRLRPRPAAQLRSLPVAHPLQDHRHDEEDGQDLQRHRQATTAASKATARWKTFRSAARTAGTSCSSPACGSRISSTTTSAAPSSASSPMPRRKARSASAPITPASAGATSSRRCT